MASAEEAIKVFISYSRTDSEFVDRLEASLLARGFGTWVDRRRLEGGEDWLDEIQHAIDSCQRQVLVLSPAAIESDYVRMEYRYARRIGKPLIPALLLPCPTVPMDLPMIQWVDFQNDYDEGIKQLLIALMREAPIPDDAMAQTNPAGVSTPDALVAAPTNPLTQPPETALRELYTAGLAARARDDLERTAIFWDQILERDPNYLDGTVASEMEAIRPRLTPIRLRRLRETADAARAHGEWAQEIAAWQGILALEPDNADAQTQLDIAQTNRTHAEQYDIARELAAKGDQEAARYQLKLLWSRAKYYGDPAGIAPGLGITVPPSYRDVQAQQQRQAKSDELSAKLADRKARRPTFRHDYLHLSLGVVLLCVFGSVLGVGVIIGYITGAIIAVGVVALFFALLSFGLGVRQAAHPVAFALVILLAMLLTMGVAYARPLVGGETRLGLDEPSLLSLPFFYYSDPFTGQRYHSHADFFAPIYPDVTSSSPVYSQNEILQLADADIYCGDMSFVGAPSNTVCIFTDQLGNSHAMWYTCGQATDSSACPQVDVGTATDLYHSAQRNAGAEGPLLGFALLLGLLWALPGALLGLGGPIFGYRIFRRPPRAVRSRRVALFGSRLIEGALVGFVAGFVLGAVIYLWSWPVGGFLSAAVLAFLASVGRMSNRRFVSVLLVTGVVLVASLILWSNLLGVESFLLAPWAIASIGGALFGLGISGSLRMWVTRPAIKQ